MSTHQMVKTRINRIKRGIPFAISGFYALGSRTSVQKSLSRLAKEGIIARVSKGFYSRPKPLESIPSIKVTANAEQVARSWAKENKHKLVSQGLEAAYQLGFQTQAPMKTIYWSNGPSRTFKVGNQEVIIRHAASSKLRWENSPLGLLFRALLSIKPEFIGLSELLNGFKRASIPKNEVQSVIKKLLKQPQLRSWQPTLHQLELQAA